MLIEIKNLLSKSDLALEGSLYNSTNKTIDSIQTIIPGPLYTN